MKRIINGVTYNVDTAAIIARYEWTDDQERPNRSVIYQTRGGAFFQVHYWEEKIWSDSALEMQNMTKVSFEALTRNELDKLVVNTDGLEIIDSSVLEDPPEAAAEISPEATIYTRVPATLKRQLDEAAREVGQSTNAFVTRCIEQCIARRAVGSDTSEGGTDYKYGERIELRHDKNSPWIGKGTIVGPTLSGAGTNLAKQWMVRFDGQHGAHAVPTICIRRAP